MTKIVFIRHGQTEWNKSGKYQGQSDVALSEEGIEQARCLAKHFPLDRLDCVYSSDLQRSMATAETVAGRFGLKVHKEEAFREISFGDWEGKMLRDIAKEEPENFEKFFMQPDELQIPNAETFQQTQLRAMEAVQKIIDKHSTEKNSHIIIVAHGSVNRTILCSFLDIPLRKMWSIAQFNTAVNILREDDGNWIVELMNSTAHLE